MIARDSLPPHLQFLAGPCGDACPVHDVIVSGSEEAPVITQVFMTRDRRDRLVLVSADNNHEVLTELDAVGVDRLLDVLTQARQHIMG